MRQSADRSRDPLIAVARAFLEGHPLRYAMRAVAALDWEATVALAESERLAPILYIALRGGAAPAHILARLRASWMAAECQQLLAGKQLRDIVGAFGGAGIQTIVLNGPALAASYYPDPALRPFIDLDLLVRRADRERALEILFERVRALKARASFVFVSHRLDEVLELSDRVYVMKDGGVFKQRS